LDAAVKVGVVGLLVLALAFPSWPQFQGKAFAGRAVGYPLALAVVPVIWSVLGRRRASYPFAADILFGAPFLIDMAGNAANLYDTIDWWDDANHLINWALHTGAVCLLLGRTRLPSLVRLGLGVAWASTTAILWELVEYVAFVPNSPEAATAYSDTLGDLALGLLGGTLASILSAAWPEARLRIGQPGRAPASTGDR
jgi:hypothetical protein